MKEEVIKLKLTVQSLAQQLQETRTVLELLAKKQGYEFSQDLHNWVAVETLNEFRKAAGK